MSGSVLQFQGKYRFLSNFWPAQIVWRGIEFPTSEHAYQAAKSLDPVQWRYIANLKTPGEAKRYGRQIPVRPDWEYFKIGAMLEIVVLKFQDPVLRMRLLATSGMKLIEGNTHGDRFWGTVDGIGENWLGKVLMAVRAAVLEPKATWRAAGLEVAAGIGSRETPAESLADMRDIGGLLATHGWGLRSGAAEGADAAFEAGFLAAGGARSRTEIYLPWRGFEDHTTGIVKSDPRAAEIASIFHDHWETMSRGPRAMHTRNSYQVLGGNLASPAGLVICWTVGGDLKGGTAQALKIATACQVPIWNLGADPETWPLADLPDFLRAKAVEIAARAGADLTRAAPAI